MKIHAERLGRERAASALDVLTSWTPPDCYVRGLHPGDIGWHLRLDDEQVDESLVLLRRGSEPVALVLFDDPASARIALSPRHRLDPEVAAAVVSEVEALPADRDLFVDVEAGSLARALLSARGWSMDPDSWVALYRPLTPADSRSDDTFNAELTGDTDVRDRVAVQRAAFVGSSFTPQRWRQMASGPTFHPTLELLRRSTEGIAVAAATGWMAGPGRCGILEPVGTDPDHSGQGHGSAVSAAVIAAMARRGASGVTVITPCTNTAAVATYERCGLRQVEILHAMVRSSVR